MTHWTQHEAIAFECAREAITDVIAIRSSQIAIETNKTQPDICRLKQLRFKRSLLVQKRNALHIEHQDKISKIRKRYGKIVSALRAA